MKHIILIVGARPNYMKAFPIYEKLANSFKLTLIHTGQHINKDMNEIFFKQLNNDGLFIKQPDIQLILLKKTKSGDFDERLYSGFNGDYNIIDELLTYDGDMGQLGEIRDKLIIEFNKLKPDLVMVFGDITSTLGATLSAKKLGIKVAHIESGLRSGDINMPEEVNRILVDYMSDYHFVSEQSGCDNLLKEGLSNNMYLVGNTMLDTQDKYIEKALELNYNIDLGFKTRDYVLITLHRLSNVDNIDKLKSIYNDILVLSKSTNIIWVIHPRTQNSIKSIVCDKDGYNDIDNIIFINPLGYLEFTCLIANSSFVITDSGGIQEECCGLNIRCFTLRNNTERPSTLIENGGTNSLISNINECNELWCKEWSYGIDFNSVRKSASMNIKKVLYKLYGVDYLYNCRKCNKEYIVDEMLYEVYELKIEYKCPVCFIKVNKCYYL